ncbi:MAG: mechanosensitive ion channel family protein, partial [Victivallaceae bacterium]|nr:mechanosensitive ion channel family protein [Victivallaceae bacterium]
WGFVEHCIRKLVKRTKTDFDDQLVTALMAPAGFLVFLIGFSASVTPLAMSTPSIFRNVILLRVFFAGAAICVVWGIFRVIGVIDCFLKKKAEERNGRLDTLLIDLVRKTVKIVILVLSILFIGQNILGVNVTALLAGAGVAGLAIAFAAQSTVSNFFGSIMIILDRPFSIGDRIKFSAIDGIVESVGFRSTQIRSLDGNLITVPNSHLADASVENVSVRPNIKHAFTLRLVYSTTPGQMRRAEEIVNQILQGHAEWFDMVKQPPRVGFSNFNSSSLDISVTVWFQTLDWWESRSMVRTIYYQIMEQFNAEGLSFAYPSQTLYLANDGEKPLKIDRHDIVS